MLLFIHYIIREFLFKSRKQQKQKQQQKKNNAIYLCGNLKAITYPKQTRTIIIGEKTQTKHKKRRKSIMTNYN